MEVINVNLKPCPFCGGPAEIETRKVYDYDNNYQYTIKCKYCDASPKTCTVDDIYFKKENAIKMIVKAWNTRSNKNFRLF